jgi:putative endonuclease
MASQRDRTLYVGVTSDLAKRVCEHKQDAAKGFTQRYQVHDLVWYEQHEIAESAISREKQIKKWNRSWKIELIQSMNPDWRDLYEDVTG